MGLQDMIGNVIGGLTGQNSQEEGQDQETVNESTGIGDTPPVNPADQLSSSTGPNEPAVYDGGDVATVQDQHPQDGSTGLDGGFPGVAQGSVSDPRDPPSGFSGTDPLDTQQS